jgi:hypothetical protein
VIRAAEVCCLDPQKCLVDEEVAPQLLAYIRNMRDEKHCLSRFNCNLSGTDTTTKRPPLEIPRRIDL